MHDDLWSSYTFKSIQEVLQGSLATRPLLLRSSRLLVGIALLHLHNGYLAAHRQPAESPHRQPVAADQHNNEQEEQDVPHSRDLMCFAGAGTPAQQRVLVGVSPATVLCDAVVGQKNLFESV